MNAASRLRLALATGAFAIFALGIAHVATAYDRANPPRIHKESRPATSSPSRATAGAFPDADPHYHNGAEMVCSDCHIAHASQTHARNPAQLGMNELVPYSGAPSENLLRASDPLDLCISCHDNQSFAPDVIGADVNGLVQRSAGHFGMPGIANPNGHDLGRGLPKSGGSYDFCNRCHFSAGDQKQVTCIDCHNAHGNGKARNLQWASDPASTPDLGLFTNPAAVNLDRYEDANVAFGTMNSYTLREVSNICIDCHHVFSGEYYTDPTGTGNHVRHPAYDSERASTNNIAQGESKGTTVPAHWTAGVGSGFGTTPRVRPVTSNSGDWGSSHIVDATRNGVFCLSCHRAHGSDQPFGLVFTAAGGVNASGCDQCHLTANVPSGPQPVSARTGR